MELSSGQFSPLRMPQRKPEPTGYTLSAHASRQAQAKGWSNDDVLAAANDPHVTYDNGRYPGQKRHIRGDLVAIVHPESRQVKTVYQNVTETELRPDQTDADAQRYGQRRR